MDNQNQQPPVVEPISPAQPVDPQPITSITPPAKSNKFLLSFVVLVLLIAVGIGAYIFGTKQTPPSQQTAIATPTKPPPSPTPDLNREPTGSAATANWKTYTDKKSQISFKYPQNGKITGEGPWIIPQSNGATANNVGISIPNGTDFVVLFYDLPQTTSIKTNDFLVINGITWHGTFNDEKTLDTKKDYCQKVNNVGCATHLIYKTVQDSHEVEVDFYNPTDKKFPQQILQTFKFTDSAANQNDAIIIAIADKMKVDKDRLEVTFDEITAKYVGLYASGGIHQKGVGGGAKWFAKNQSGTWIIIFIGNGIPQCVDVARYNAPYDFLACVDNDGKLRNK